MRILEYPREKAAQLVELLNAQEKFQVLASLVHEDTFAAYVICGHAAFTLGHFYRPAFCGIQPLGENRIVLSIVHLNLQKTWYGVNVFQSVDKRIEDEIYEYVSHQIPGWKVTADKP